MRLLSVTVLGTALVTAGLAAPAVGQATATGRGRITVEPGAARPGQRVQLSVPGCVRPRDAASAAFTGRAPLDGRGHGTATVKREVKPDMYTIEARCGARTVSGRFKVSNGLAWPAMLTPSNDL
ncbi:hypothetical protein AGRA3207_004756 [Actinomadura graeca]|uniref:Secreted protein n=1 Tax=Actinomadura graeca TaxID=2750812 RepID=A0ABX8QXQ5_9ACTN|nr:hypothetical protein [Actinomadura graeca]QXJ23581.1 hypothetical protein AGRA3207_004756 [Actinomadura graeca]